MSNVRGTISVDVAFTDSTTVDGAQSLKTITLRDATEYTTGKVAIVTGTVGTSGFTVNLFPSGYRNSAGELVSFDNGITRVAFLASRRCSLDDNGNQTTITQSNGSIAIGDTSNIQPDIVVWPLFTAGTASFTAILYGT
jgi:hypothetical protein